MVCTRPALAGAYRLELAAGLGCTSDYILCRRASYTGIDVADAEQPVKERKPKSKAAKAPLTAEEAEEVARQKRVAEAQAYNKETREEMRRAVRASGAPRSKTKLFGRRHVSKLSFQERIGMYRACRSVTKTPAEFPHANFRPFKSNGNFDCTLCGCPRCRKNPWIDGNADAPSRTCPAAALLHPLAEVVHAVSGSHAQRYCAFRSLGRYLLVGAGGGL